MTLSFIEFVEALARVADSMNVREPALLLLLRRPLSLLLLLIPLILLRLPLPLPLLIPRLLILLLNKKQRFPNEKGCWANFINYHAILFILIPFVL